MQTPKASGTVKKTRRRTQLSCTECRRRKQKCNPRPEGGCGNCIRRYPPVQCIFLPDPKKPKEDASAVSQEVKGLDTPAAASASGSGSGSGSGSASSTNCAPSYHAVPLSSLLGPSHDVVHLGVSRDFSHSELELEVASTLSSSLGSSSISIRRNDRSSSRNAISTPSTEDGDSSPPYSKEQGLPLFKTSSSSPTPFAGALTQINGMHGAYVKNTMRNAELWSFFHDFVVPNMCSVDGSTTSLLFRQEMLPWMIQSPLMPHIAILMSSAAQTAEPELQIIKSSETFGIKSQVLSLINDFLRQDFNVVGGEALRAVIHLVVVEWWWGSTSSLWAHMKGVKQMLKLRGGFQGMNDPILQQVLFVSVPPLFNYSLPLTSNRTDFELACCFERDLFLLDPNMANHMPISVPPTYPESLRSPLLAYHETFRHDRVVLGLSDEATEILDDVRFLTLSITSASDQSSTSKIQSTAGWLHKQISSSPPFIITPDTPLITIITSTIRLITVLYTLSISTLIPLSHLWTSSLLEQFYRHLFSISMSKWKEIPGIFLWIMLVASPGSQEDERGKWLKRKMAVAGMQVGMADFGVSISCLRAFWRVQRWVESERLKQGKIRSEEGGEK
ncbi:hypothetical protein EG329_005917 [Mollisiaceae sp. DMI_Dod_QoI]|nr:hypothetical protein EG329_005917 [Helotiales sp. DMI_Dod_QoI]